MEGNRILCGENSNRKAPRLSISDDLAFMPGRLSHVEGAGGRVGGELKEPLVCRHAALVAEVERAGSSSRVGDHDAGGPGQRIGLSRLLYEARRLFGENKIRIAPHLYPIPMTGQDAVRVEITGRSVTEYPG